MALPDWFWPVAAAPFVGSFLSVLVTRLPTGSPALWGRSACDACHHVLGIRDLVPLASWLAAGRRCRHCGAPVSSLYPAIEAGALLLAIWASTVMDGAWLWLTCGLGWCLLALTAIDIRCGLLPDMLTLPLILGGLAVAYWDVPIDMPAHLLGATGGFGMLWGARTLYRRLRHRDGLGLGDTKLMAAGGAWVAWEALPSVLLLACLSSLTWVLIAQAWGERPTLNRRMPFGPGLCVGIWLAWLYGPLG